MTIKTGSQCRRTLGSAEHRSYTLDRGGRTGEQGGQWWFWLYWSVLGYLNLASREVDPRQRIMFVAALVNSTYLNRAHRSLPH